MQLTHQPKVAHSAILFLIFAPMTLLAQLSVNTNRETAFFQQGESMFFHLKTDSTGSVDYVIQYGNESPPLAAGTVHLLAGQTLNIPFSLPTPGMVVCKIQQNNRFAMATAAFSPYEIKPFEAEPADFDLFWKNKKALLNAVPIDAQLTPFQSDTAVTTFRLSLASIEGRRVYGYLSIPSGVGPFPAVLTLPPFGYVLDLVVPEDFLARQSKVISLAISVLNAPPGQADSLAYLPNVKTNRDSIYYKYAILGAQRALDYLYARPDFDKTNLAVSGVSQGGGLSIIMAGLDPRVKLMMQSNAGLCEHAGYKYGREGGFPYFTKGANDPDPILAAAKYYDAVFFARRYKGPSLNIICYRDEVCPPATVFAAFNQLTGPKTLLHALELGHDHPNEFWSGRTAYLHQYFGTPYLPNPTMPALLADAGEPITATLGQTLQLTAHTYREQAETSDLTVLWSGALCEKDAHFAPENQYNTAFTPDSLGLHALLFGANDYTKLPIEQRYYTFFDQTKILVNAPDFALPTPCASAGSVFFPQHIVAVRLGELQHPTGPSANADFTHYFTTLRRGNNHEIGLLPAITGQPDAAHWRVWIDLNQDGDFEDAGEQVFQKISNKAVRGYLTIPANAALGLTRMRVSLKGDADPLPCDVFGQGEVEDYSVLIQDAPLYCLAEANPNTTAGYCASKANNPWQEWIAGIKMADLHHESDKSQYSDFTDYSATVQAGKSYQTNLTAGLNWVTEAEYWSVWVDFDRNETFDAYERMLTAQTAPPPPGTQQFDFDALMTIPDTAQVGTYRMRVSMSRTQGISPCDTFDFGEVEDYLLVVTTDTTQVQVCALNATITDLQCLIDVADTYTFSLLVSGSNTSSNWLTNLQGINIASEYGAAVQMGNIPISVGPIQFVVSDAANGACSTSVQVVPPAPCYLGPCDINAALNNIECLPGQSDFYLVSIMLEGTNVSESWVGDLNGTAIMGHYGASFLLGTQSFAGGDLVLEFSDSLRTYCTAKLTIPHPAPCESAICSIHVGELTTECLPEMPDTYNISIRVNGANGSSTWATQFAGNPIMGNYGDSIFVGQASISAGLLNLNITDVEAPGCNTLLTVIPPDPCPIEPCSLFVVATEVHCEADQPDSYRFSMIAFGNGVMGNAWDLGIHGVFYTGMYGVATEIGGLPISEGPLMLQISDVLFPNCYSSLSITPPDPCFDDSPYCEVESENTQFEWIENVTFGDVVHESGPGHYSNFTYISDTLRRDLPNVLRIRPGFMFQQNRPEQWAVWIDFDQNGAFDTLAEQVFLGASTAQDSMVSAVFDIPTDALVGSTRMRIRMQRDTISDSCTNFPFGEVEDYSVYLPLETSIGTKDVTGQKHVSLEVFPNPTKDWISIKLLDAVDNPLKALALLDALGREMDVFLENFAPNGSLIRFSVERLPSGVYFLRIQLKDGESRVVRFVRR